MKTQLPLLFLLALPAAAGTDCWTYVPGSPRGTISWTDSSGFENIVKGIDLEGTQVKIKANQNRSSTTLKNADFSIPVETEDGSPLAYSPDFLAGDNANAVLGYITGLTNIVVNANATSLGRYCFKGNTGLVRVRLNDGLETILGDAFNGCSALVAIDNGFPDSVKTIEGGAFRSCTKLTGPLVANGLETIADRVFHSDPALRSVDFSGSSLTNIPEFVFYNCSGLEFVALPDSLTTLGEGCFSGASSLRILTPLLPPKLVTLGSDGSPAIANCPLEGHVVSPPSLERIGTRAFRTSKIETFTAARKGLKTVGQYAFFQNYNLTNVVLSTTMEGIESQWLEGSGRSGVPQHVWFRNLPASLSSGLWSGTTVQNITVHLPWSQRDAWREWVASGPSGHTFKFNGATGTLPEHRNDIGTWTAGKEQYVTWWKDLEAPTLVLIK